jgi:hypothetical protein
MDKHTHKYIRIKIGKNKRIEYRCAIPGCVHHIRPELVTGRFSLCNKCNNEFTMDKYATKLAKPTCLSCRTATDIKELAALFEE